MFEEGTMVRRHFFITILLLGLLILNACSRLPLTESKKAPSLAEELVFADWEGDMPQSVLDAFTAEYGVKVRYHAYEVQEEAMDEIRNGMQVDVLVLESRFIPQMVREHLLARINYQNVTNFKNISPNFRGLVYDPDNEYSIPYNWGTTALVVRTDLAEQPITRWADLWDPRYAGRTAIWVGQTREVIAIALKSLGYSANSEDPRELQDALEHLINLKKNVIFLEDYKLTDLPQIIADGQIVAAMGYAGDIIAAQQFNAKIAYVYPQEGALLWGDTFVIPVTSQNSYPAEVFLNFLLRPDMNAQIANENYYATPNEAAFPFIDPQILNDPVIFPPNESLRNAEIILPLSPEGQKLYDEVWERFLAAQP
jgi:spermidine/putrescine transport system substrate-binding protein